MRVALLATVLVAAAVALGACGAASRAHRPGGGRFSLGSFVAGGDGAVVFARSCRSCHTLVGDESAHTQGGDLLRYRMTVAELTSFTREMPVRRPLTAHQLRAVVQYVLAAERTARR